MKPIIKKKRTKKNKVRKSFKGNKKSKRIKRTKRTKRTKKTKRTKRTKRIKKMMGGMEAHVISTMEGQTSPRMNPFEIYKKGDLSRSWRKRWAVIRGDSLLFFKKNPLTQGGDHDPSDTSISKLSSSEIRLTKDKKYPDEMIVDIIGTRLGGEGNVSIRMPMDNYETFMEVYGVLKEISEKENNIRILQELNGNIMILISDLIKFLNSKGFGIKTIDSFDRGSGALIVVVTKDDDTKKVLKIKLSGATGAQQLEEYRIQASVQELGENITIGIDLDSFCCFSSNVRSDKAIFRNLKQLEDNCRSLQRVPNWRQVISQIGGNIELASLKMPELWSDEDTTTSYLEYDDPSYPMHLSVVMMDYFDGIKLATFNEGAYGYIIRVKNQRLSDVDLIRLIQADPNAPRGIVDDVSVLKAQNLLEGANREWARNLYSVLEDLRNKINTIHRAGIYHCDMNLSNVMVDLENYTVRIIDFGEAEYNIDLKKMREELDKLEVEALKKRAEEIGVEETALEDIDDEPDVKGALIALILPLWEEESRCKEAPNLRRQPARIMTQPLIKNVCGETDPQWNPESQPCVGNPVIIKHFSTTQEDTLHGEGSRLG